MQRPGPGEILGDKYRLVAQLGKGGMGAVWRAEHLTLHAPVALKLVHSLDPDAGEHQRFLAEARTAAALRSEHVVQILDYGVWDGTPYIAMELLEGESLRARLDRVTRLPLAEVVMLVRQISRAVTRAHRTGIVHRDLKPDNLFIVRNDGDEILKVLDFGIAKASPNLLGTTVSHETPTGLLIGTPQYMSPEQAEGMNTLDYKTDLWSMGVIVFECLLGKPPFAGDTLGALIMSICSRPLPIPSQHGSVPSGFDDWFARACARDAKERFESAHQLSEALNALSGSDKAPGTPSAHAPVAGATPKRSTKSSLPPGIEAKHRRTLAWQTSAIGATVLAVLCGAWLLASLRGSPSSADAPPQSPLVATRSLEELAPKPGATAAPPRANSRDTHADAGVHRPDLPEHAGKPQASGPSNANAAGDTARGAARAPVKKRAALVSPREKRREAPIKERKDDAQPAETRPVTRVPGIDLGI